MTSSDQSDTEINLRTQLEISKEFLEYSHGAAVKYKNVEKAKAYYEALELVDDALEGNWDPEKHVENPWDGIDLELIEESREARDQGVKAATLHDHERIQENRRKFRETSLLDILLPWRSA